MTTVDELFEAFGRQPDVLQEQPATQQAQTPASDVPVVGPTGEVAPAPTLEDVFGSVGAQQQRSIGGRALDRFLGRDVSDPQEFKRLVGTVAGGVSGAMAGARTARAPGAMGVVVNPITGALVGGLAGTAGGTAAPEAFVQGAEDMGLVPQGTRDRVTLSNEELRTVIEGELLLDLITAGGVSAVRGIGRQVGRRAAGITPEAQALAERSAQMGVDLMPVQVGDRAIGRGFVAVMGKFPLVGVPFRRQAEVAEGQFAQLVRDMPERVAPLMSRSDLGVQMFQDAENLLRAVNRSFDQSYSEVFQRADQLGVKVAPRHTMNTADEILERIAQETPTPASRVLGREGVEPGAGAVLDDVADFIRTEILPLREAVAGGDVIARQTLRQMDGLMSKIDQKLLAMEPSQRKFAQSLMQRLRQSAANDIATNTRGPAGSASTIGQELRQLDQEFSHLMSEIFETSAAKRFGSVKRRGIRAREFDEVTRTPVDELARFLVRLDSPQLIDETRRLVTPDTFQRIGASVLDDAIEGAIRQSPDGTFRFSAETFERNLGFDRAVSPRRQAVDKLLQDAGIGEPEISAMVEAGRRIAGLEVPSASTFVARRGTLGGRDAVVNAFLAGGAAGHTARGGGVTSALMSTLMFLGGTRILSAALANPASARAFREVMDTEADRGVRRAAALKTLRLVVEGAQSDEIPDTVERSYQMGRQFMLGMERGQMGMPIDQEAAPIQDSMQAIRRERREHRRQDREQERDTRRFVPFAL